MRRHWQRIAIEIILGILIELAPASLDMWATIAEYLVQTSSQRVSVQVLFSSSDRYSEYSLEALLLA